MVGLEAVDEDTDADVTDSPVWDKESGGLIHSHLMELFRI